jgi:peptidyl-dipeptidase A
MKRQLLAACAVAALAGCATAAATPSAPVAEAVPPPVAAAPAEPTAADAAAFVADAEARLEKMSEYVGRISWVRNTYITYDTMALEAQANAEFTEMGVKLAKESARFNDTPGVDPVVRRKLNLLKLGLTLPAPDRPGAAEELAQIGTRMDSTYSTG